MKKELRIALNEREILEINSLMEILENKIKDFEFAYSRRDHVEFNLIKKEIIQTQRRIDRIIE